MFKIKLTALDAADMRVIAWLLRREVITPVMFCYDLTNNEEFLINNILINLFCKRFNKMVFESRKHTVTINQMEAASLLKKITQTEGDSEVNAYMLNTFTRLKTSLHKDLTGLPVHDKLPF